MRPTTASRTRPHWPRCRTSSLAVNPAAARDDVEEVLLAPAGFVGIEFHVVDTGGVPVRVGRADLRHRERRPVVRRDPVDDIAVDVARGDDIEGLRRDFAECRERLGYPQAPVSRWNRQLLAGLAFSA